MAINASDQTILNEELREYESMFRAAQRDVHGLVDGLDDGQFNWRPGENAWSVAECLDHLVVMGAAMLPKIDEGIALARERGWRSDGPFRHGAIGNWFVRAVGPSESARKRKFKAPRLYTPTSNHSISRLLTAFTESQDRYIERVHAANGYDLARVKIASPVTRLIRFSLGQWFALLAGHQQRHFLQAQEVRQKLKS